MEAEDWVPSLGWPVAQSQWDSGQHSWGTGNTKRHKTSSGLSSSSYRATRFIHEGHTSVSSCNPSHLSRSPPLSTIDGLTLHLLDLHNWGPNFPHEASHNRLKPWIVVKCDVSTLSHYWPKVKIFLEARDCSKIKLLSLCVFIFKCETESKVVKHILGSHKVFKKPEED